MIPLNPLSLRHGPQNGCYGHFRVSIDDDDAFARAHTRAHAPARARARVYPEFSL